MFSNALQRSTAYRVGQVTFCCVAIIHGHPHRWDFEKMHNQPTVVADLAALPMSDRIIFRRLVSAADSGAGIGSSCWMINWLDDWARVSPHAI